MSKDRPKGRTGVDPTGVVGEPRDVFTGVTEDEEDQKNRESRQGTRTSRGKSPDVLHTESVKGRRTEVITTKEEEPYE